MCMGLLIGELLPIEFQQKNESFSISFKQLKPCFFFLIHTDELGKQGFPLMYSYNISNSQLIPYNVP